MKKLFLLAVGLASLVAWQASATVSFNVDVYSGVGNTGTDGTPFSGYVGSYQKPWIDWGGYPAADPSGTVYNQNWHPDGLGSFGARLTGAFTAPADGNYTFWTYSDDGSRMFVDGSPVVYNDGPHGPGLADGSAYLTAGYHTMTVNFYEAFGGESGVTAFLDPALTPTAVPEPSTWLAGAGMLAGMLGTLIRRKA